MKRLLEIEKLDKSIKAAATTELSKLRKAQALYKEKSKEMQKKIAGKLFGTTGAPGSMQQPNSQEAGKDPETRTPVVETVVENTQKPQEGKDRPAPKQDGAKEAGAQASKSSSNIVFLLATSFVVVFLSMYLAWSYKEKN